METPQFNPGDLVRFATGEGPLLIVAGPAENPDGDREQLLACGYYNAVTGSFSVFDFSPGLLKRYATADELRSYCANDHDPKAQLKLPA